MAVEKCLPYEVFKESVLNYGKSDELHVPQDQFMPRIGTGTVMSKVVTKEYRVINPKAIIDDRSENLDCYPFGY